MVTVVRYRLSDASDPWSFHEHSPHLDRFLVQWRAHFCCSLTVVLPLAYLSSLQMKQNLLSGTEVGS